MIDNTDDIPEFLRVKNRVPLSDERRKELDEKYKKLHAPSGRVETEVERLYRLSKERDRALRAAKTRHAAEERWAKLKQDEADINAVKTEAVRVHKRRKRKKRDVSR